MAFQIHLSEARLRAEKAHGLWPDRILTDYLDEAVKAAPNQVAITGANSATGERTTLTYAELAHRVERIALGLAALGARLAALESQFVDDDGDTFSEVQDDCDDTNADVSPLADEIAGNGIDDDCDHEIDEAV